MQVAATRSAYTLIVWNKEKKNVVKKYEKNRVGKKVARKMASGENRRQWKASDCVARVGGTACSLWAITQSAIVRQPAMS